MSVFFPGNVESCVNELRRRREIKGSAKSRREREREIESEKRK